MKLLSTIHRIITEIQKDAEKCIRCNLCVASCPLIPIISNNLRADPRMLSIDILRDIYRTAPIMYDSLYYCTTCMKCNTVCPSGISITRSILMLRSLTMQKAIHDKVFQIKFFIKSLLKHKNPYSAPPNMRCIWANNIDFKKEVHKSRITIWLGCTTSIRTPTIAKTTYLSLREILGNEVTLLGEKEGCCGKPALLIGDENAAKELLSEAVDTVESVGTEILVTPCPACYSMFKSGVKELLNKEPSFKVMHYTEFIHNVISQDLINLGEISEYGKVSYHDPCELGRGMGIFDEPRYIINKIVKGEIVEVLESRELSRCCGGGGGVWAFHTDLAMSAAVYRLSQFMKQNVKALISACPTCYLNFKYTIMTYEIPVKILDISQIVLKSLQKIN